MGVKWSEVYRAFMDIYASTLCSTCQIVTRMVEVIFNGYSHLSYTIWI
jgi:hypothetical protein